MSSAAENVPVSHKKYTILIVDDSSSNLMVLERYLKDQGFETLVATKGELALKQVQYTRPDLILLDIMMPGIDGFETCRHLKVDESTKDIPVIFMTALTSVEDKVKGFEVGGVDYITKPFQYEEILARVMTHLRLRDLTLSLQQQTSFLSKRAAQLEISSQVAQQVTSILNPAELLTAIVQLIQRKFNYYFVSVWLLDEQKEKIILQAGSGKEGTSQASQGFALSMKTNKSIIVTACQTGRDYLADDVQADPRYFSWEGLPDTQSELAIALHFGQEILGVLDIQSDQVAAFDREDRTVLQTLANQIGIAIRNARLYSQLERVNKQLEEASLTDPLTGMRNRRYLLKFIHADIAKVHRDYTDKTPENTDPLQLNSDIAFLLLDLDHFKSVNDTYGHEAGDRVLSQMRDILEKYCRKTDILIRWGGEEFLIEGRYSNRRYIQSIAKRVQKAVQEHPFDIGDNRTVHLTCSLGFACYPFLPLHPESLSWEQVISLADRGLYAAKMSGRNAYVGLAGTETTSPKELFQHIQHDITDLINSGELIVVTSLSDTANLVFYE